jgi:hypothetical protein
VCEDEPAVLSLLNYADYQQLKLGANCAPNVMRGIADGMDGRETAERPPEAPPDPVSSSESAADDPASTSTESSSDDGEPGSAKDHWASTTHVRRSTHGHRTPRGTAGKPREGEPE